MWRFNHTSGGGGLINDPPNVTVGQYFFFEYVWVNKAEV